jgi:hypothetical protein
MARRHIVRTTVPVEVSYACASCGFSARAMVEGRGVGSASSYLFFDRKRARAKAGEEAVAEAAYDAHVTASIAPCPRCFTRSRSAVASFVIRSVLATIGWLVLGGTLWWLIDGGLRWLVLALLLAAAAGTVRRRRMRYQLGSTLLRNVRPEVVLPRAEVRSLPPPPARARVVAPPISEPTPPTDEPRRLR